jgi:hypothetical protein
MARNQQQILPQIDPTTIVASSSAQGQTERKKKSTLIHESLTSSGSSRILTDFAHTNKKQSILERDRVGFLRSGKAECKEKYTNREKK